MNTVILAILDGWGIGKKDETNPIYTANTETIDYLQENFRSGSLNSSGLSVGLPWGQAGTSEVGNLTLGSGRVVDQNFRRINKSIDSGDFFDNPAFKKAFQHSKQNNSKVHLAGLLTEGAVHSSIDHLKALIKMAAQMDAPEVWLHLFTDGVESPPESASSLIEEVRESCKKHGVGKIGSISGRYYGLDNNENWDRTRKVWEVMRGKGGEVGTEKALKQAYQKNLSDRYVAPSVIDKDGGIEDGDAIIFFNFREDSSSQIARSFGEGNFDEFEANNPKNLFVTTMTNYDSRINSAVAFRNEEIKNTLGEVLSKNNKLQLRLAETEKESHVTQFFNGFRSEPFENEYRIMIPSDRSSTPAQNPYMKAKDIADRALLSLEEGNFSFILLNFANPDSIAHTGDYKATTEGVEFVDKQLGKILNGVMEKDAGLIVTSDHGNAEELFDSQTGKAETRHSPNPVPIYLAGKGFEKTSSGGSLEKAGMLSDVAPTVLDLLDLEKPTEMTGNSLVDILS